MKLIFFTSLLLFTTLFLFAQNVGVGTSTPTEKLDVDGNINLSGTIKANGTAGEPNQVLTTNSEGNLTWSGEGETEYLNRDTFKYTSYMNYQSWVVPAGVTKINVEVWGAGGAAFIIPTYFAGASGGGGGYINADINVTPGDMLSIVVGYHIHDLVDNGGVTFIQSGSVLLKALAGTNASGPATQQGQDPKAYAGYGGGYQSTNGVVMHGMKGENGNPDIVHFSQFSGGAYMREIHYGNGGNAGNTVNTGGIGGFRILDAITGGAMANVYGGNSSSPGGGGCNYNPVIPGGSDGLAVIHY
ncbi:MAG TPA: hypothetical protein VFG10_03550 [Saprospiraceae bacterium]|nr:hypothetical protein [Saprospiraceae bacterium]